MYGKLQYQTEKTKTQKGSGKMKDLSELRKLLDDDSDCYCIKSRLEMITSNMDKAEKISNALEAIDVYIKDAQFLQKKLFEKVDRLGSHNKSLLGIK